MKDAFVPVAMTEQNPKWQKAISRETFLYKHGNDIRSDFDRDYTRLLHCSAFRRLKHKTQVFFAPSCDHICTRMEHVNHVCSVSSTIAKALGLNVELVNAIALGHDIGHAPFGHHGEDCLNSLIKGTPKDSTNPPFWHERNSLFFADFIETLPAPNGDECPLDLTYAVRDGIVCHCGEIDGNAIRPREDFCDLYDIKARGASEPFSWEGCVVKLSDKIAFLGRDIEDARTSHILNMSSYRQLCDIVEKTLKVKNHDKHTGKAINTTVLINDLIVDLCKQSSIEKGLCFSTKYFDFILALRDFNMQNIYNHWRLVEFQHYATNIIKTLHDTLMRTQDYAINGRIDYCLKYYPELRRTFEDWLVRYTDYCPKDFPNRKEILHYKTPVCFFIKDILSYQKCIIEYISGMTDNFAITCYHEIIAF